MGQIPEGGRPGNCRSTPKKRGRTEGIAILRCGDPVWARQPGPGSLRRAWQVGHTWAGNLQGMAERQAQVWNPHSNLSS